MKKLFMIASLAAISFLVCGQGWGLSFTNKKVIFSQGQDTWVKIVKANKKLTPLEHPCQLTAQDMDQVLASLQYFRPDTFSVSGNKGKEFDLFTDEERGLVAAPLAEALAQAGPEEWVDFSINSFRGPMLIGSFRQSDGVMFIKDGQLNVALRNIAAKTSPETSVNTYDPTKGYRALTKLVAVEGQTLKQDNWVIMDPRHLPVPPPPKPEEGGLISPQQPAPPPAAATPAPAAPQRPAKERLLELQQLYDAGLITEQEYKQKREEILKQL